MRLSAELLPSKVNPSILMSSSFDIEVRSGETLIMAPVLLIIVRPAPAPWIRIPRLINKALVHVHVPGLHVIVAPRADELTAFCSVAKSQSILNGAGFTVMVMVELEESAPSVAVKTKI